MFLGNCLFSLSILHPVIFDKISIIKSNNGVVVYVLYPSEYDDIKLTNTLKQNYIQIDCINICFCSIA